MSGVGTSGRGYRQATKRRRSHADADHPREVRMLSGGVSGSDATYGCWYTGCWAWMFGARRPPGNAERTNDRLYIA